MFILLSLLISTVHAGPKKTVEKVSLKPEIKFEEAKPQEGMMKPLPAAPEKSGATVTIGCQNDAGLNYKAGDPGYEACLAEMQMKAGRSKDFNNGRKDQGGATGNVNFTIGK